MGARGARSQQALANAIRPSIANDSRAGEQIVRLGEERIRESAAVIFGSRSGLMPRLFSLSWGINTLSPSTDRFKPPQDWQYQETPRLAGFKQS
jgi:hypothetical protein